MMTFRQKTTEQTYERIVRSAPKGRTDDSVVFLLFKASAKQVWPKIQALSGYILDALCHKINIKSLNCQFGYLSICFLDKLFHLYFIKAVNFCLKAILHNFFNSLWRAWPIWAGLRNRYLGTYIIVDHLVIHFISIQLQYKKTIGQFVYPTLYLFFLYFRQSRTKYIGKNAIFL